MLFYIRYVWQAPALCKHSGQYEDVIYDYRTCRHKLSEHGSSNRKCRCRHPSNKAIGINFS